MWAPSLWLRSVLIGRVGSRAALRARRFWVFQDTGALAGIEDVGGMAGRTTRM